MSNGELAEQLEEAKAELAAVTNDRDNQMTARELAEAEIERLKAELAASQQTNREWLAANGPGGWIDDLRKQLTAHPAPSGWQQRIEAAFREGYDFGQADRRWFLTDADSAWSRSGTRQNAVDALPPEPEVKDATPVPILDELHAILAQHGTVSRRPEHYMLVTDLVHWAARACRQSKSITPDAEDAIPPGLEGPTGAMSRFDAWLCRCGCVRRDHDDLGRCLTCISCVEFKPVDASTEDRLANLFNAFADDVERMPDEELIAEIIEDGGDPDAIAERTRRLLADTVERFKVKQAKEATASPKEPRDDR
jgi:hypothetical protein